MSISANPVCIRSALRLIRYAYDTLPTTSTPGDCVNHADWGDGMNEDEFFLAVKLARLLNEYGVTR